MKQMKMGVYNKENRHITVNSICHQIRSYVCPQNPVTNTKASTHKP